jgi:hypothetical protein
MAMEGGCGALTRGTCAALTSPLPAATAFLRAAFHVSRELKANPVRPTQAGGQLRKLPRNRHEATGPFVHRPRAG